MQRKYKESKAREELRRLKFLKKYARYIRNGKRYFGVWRDELTLFDFMQQCGY